MAMEHKTVTTAEVWAKVQAMGTYEDSHKNGELWSLNGKLYYLSHLSLDPQELREVVAFYSGPETI